MLTILIPVAVFLWRGSARRRRCADASKETAENNLEDRLALITGGKPVKKETARSVLSQPLDTDISFVEEYLVEISSTCSCFSIKRTSSLTAAAVLVDLMWRTGNCWDSSTPIVLKLHTGIAPAATGLALASLPLMLG